MRNADDDPSLSDTAEGNALPGMHPLGGNIKHYEIIRKLGQGGMGMVYLARDTKLGRLVAIKMLLESAGQEAARFLSEARATARCKHENIVVIHEVDDVRGAPYMVLEYIEGRTLRAWMTQREPGPVPPRLAVELTIPVVRALCCAHQMGIVHRDLKPENILLTDTGQVKVLDFGIAKRVATDTAAMITAARAGLAGRAGHTEDGLIIGTPPYMSPEQWHGDGIDAQSDLWAIGIILYELVAGAHPLNPLTRERLREVPIHDIPMPSARDRRADAGALADVIDRCLKKHKVERIGSAKELLAELEPLVRDRAARATEDDESPFAGLSAFQESDAGRFFGRDRDVAAVVGQLRNHALMTVAGPSGAGKSSFVRAGVIPALKRSGARWEAFVVRPGRHPLTALADVLAQGSEDTTTEAGPRAPDAADPGALVATLRAQPGTLGARLRARCRRLGGTARILLFIDQFEELYTLGIDPAERAAFLTCLEAVADDASSPLRVMIAMRSDFLDRMAEGDSRFMTEVTRGLVFLRSMGREGLREALTRPLDAAGCCFETVDMIDEMLDALQGTRSPLPLLQFTATKLWEARDRGRNLLSRDSYRALGGVAGALSTHAETIFAAFSAPEQRLARAILVRLVTPERTRAIVSLGELRALEGNGDVVEQVVHRLAGARLLLIETGSEREGATVELIHESLIDRWVKLGRWLDENEQDAQFVARLRAAASQWDASGQAEGLLWRDEAAEDARRWLQDRRGEQGECLGVGLGKREERYLLAVVALGERARRLRRRIVVGVIAALGMIAVVVSLLALRANQQARRADDQAARAQVEAVQARNATRMAAARELSDDPTTALALLREIEPPDVPRGWSGLAYRALHGGVAHAVLVHPEAVHRAAFSPDGERIVTASKDHLARVWNADGGGEPLVLRGHDDAISWADFSPDGKRIVTASDDHTARIWNADGTGEPLVLRGHTARVWSAVFSPDSERVVTASKDHLARVWNIDGTGEPMVLRGHGDQVVSAVFSPDGERIVSVSPDHTARVWSADGTDEPLVLRGHEAPVTAASFSPDGKRIVTASFDKTARVWSTDGTGEPLVLRGHEGAVMSAVFSHDGERIVTASFDKTARVWSADGTGEPLILRGHDDRVVSAAFSRDDEHVVTTSFDQTARLWSADGTGEPLVHSHRYVVLSAEFSPDGNYIVTVPDGSSPHVWSANGTGEPVVLRGHTNMVTWVSFSPDGKRVVTASLDETARVWSADGAGEPFVLRGHKKWVSSAEFSPDGRRIMTSSRDGTVRVWNADGTGEPQILRSDVCDHHGAVMSAELSPDGKRIVAAYSDKIACVWGAGEMPLVLRGHEDLVFSAAFSPDGKRIVTASADTTARVWSADGAGEPLVVLRGHTGSVRSAEFSPDGKRIVTASNDGTARVWDIDGAGAALVLRGHEDLVLSAAFSPDGKRIVTASQDNTVRVWNADGTGVPLVLIGSSRQAFNHAVFSPDGKRIAAASDDKSVWIWTDLEPLSGPDDPRLWTATTYCITIKDRVALLGISEGAAQTQEQACQRRVQLAREAASTSPRR